MDPSYEYDAPRYYDFKREDDGTSMASRWFDDRMEDDGWRSPLGELHDQATSKAPAQATTSQAAAKAPAAGPAPAAPGGIVSMLTNIVTSWGGAAAGKKAQAPKPASSKKQAPAPPSRDVAGAVTREPAPPPPQPQQQQEEQAQEKQHAQVRSPPVTRSVTRRRMEWSKTAGQADDMPSRQLDAALLAAELPKQQQQQQQQQQVEEDEGEDEEEQQGGARQAPGPSSRQGGAPGPSNAVKPQQQEQEQQQAAAARPHGSKATGAAAKKAARGDRGGMASGGAAAAAARGKRADSTIHRVVTVIGKRVAKARRLSHTKAKVKAAVAAAAMADGPQALPAARQRPAAATGAKLKRVLRPHKVMAARSTKPLTLPDDVELRTSKRARRHCAAEEEAGQAEGAGGTPFKALALKVRDFQNKTPARFRTKAAPPPEHRPLSITEPKAPLLLTTTRTRPTNIKSAEEREREELEAMPKFHATKLNPAVLQGAGQLQRPAERPPITEPAPFMFVTDDRAERRRKRDAPDHGEEQHQHAFKAQALDRSILEGPVGLPSRQRRASTTVAKSPLLHTKLRAKEAPSSLGRAEFPKHEFHARPVPQYLQLPREFQVSSAQREAPAPTQPAPFHLRTEARGKHYEKELKARLDTQDAAAREARIPRAQLLPLSLDAPVVPPRPEPKGLTMPRPFNLRSEARHQEFREGLTKERREEEEARRAEAEFKARPLPDLGHAFQVHESGLPLTVPQEPHLATGARAVEREEFDHAVEEKAKMMEEQRQREEAARQAEEERAVRELRRGLVVPARPVPDFSRPFMAMPSARPLTNPLTPKLGRKKGAKRARGE